MIRSHRRSQLLTRLDLIISTHTTHAKDDALATAIINSHEDISVRMPRTDNFQLQLVNDPFLANGGTRVISNSLQRERTPLHLSRFARATARLGKVLNLVFGHTIKHALSLQHTQ